jgi:hypothetical protein
MLKSQGQTKSNFQAMNTVFGQNHVPFTGDSTVSGMHTTLTFREQSGDPTTLVDQVALYTKNVGGLPALFFRPNNNQTPIQMTLQNLKTGLQSKDPDVYYSEQYSFVAGAFIVYGGYLKNVNSGAVITLTPTSTLIYVGLTMNQHLRNASYIAAPVLPAIPGSSFTVEYQNGLSGQNIYYFAIGKP